MVLRIFAIIAPGNDWVLISINRDSMVHGADIGPIWGRQDTGGPHVGPMNFAIWEGIARK